MTSKQFSTKATLLILAIFMAGALGMTCPENGPCTAIDLEDENQQSIKLTNRSGTPIHILVNGESFDPCNRVNAEGSRFAFLSGNFDGVTVRVGSNGQVFDTIVCDLPEESEIIYTSTGELICVHPQ